MSLPATLRSEDQAIWLTVSLARTANSTGSQCRLDSRRQPAVRESLWGHPSILPTNADGLLGALVLLLKASAQPTKLSF